MPEAPPFVSPADLASIQMELSADDEPPDAGDPNHAFVQAGAHALMDHWTEEELAKKELESMAIVDEKLVKKKPPKNLNKKDRKPRNREARKNMRKEFFEALDAEGNVIESDAKRFVKGEGGLPPEQGQSSASKLLAEELEKDDEPLAPPPEPEPPLVDEPPLDEVGRYQELIKAIYAEKNPEKLSDLDKLYKKYDTVELLKRAYDFICEKYAVTDAP